MFIIAREVSTMKNGNMAKQEYIGFRTTTEIREILERMAKKGYRTLSQQCEMIIIEWLKDNGHLDKEEPD
jgi:ribosomal protein S8